MIKTNKLQSIFLALLDVLLLNLGVALAFIIRFDFSWPKYNLDPYLRLIPWQVIAAFIMFYMFDLYANWRRKSIFNLIYSVIIAVLALSLLSMVMTFWYRGFGLPRSIILISTVIQVILITTIRSMIWIVDKRLFGRKKVLIVGVDPEDGLALAEKFLEHTTGWFIVHDFVPVNKLKELRAKIEDVEVVLLSPNVNDKMEIIHCCTEYGKELLIVPEAFELFILGSEPQQVDDMLVLSIQPPRLSSSQKLIKRLFDLVVSFTILVIVSPVMLLLYILIPLTSAGPALFKQVRLGRDGEPYNVLKLRSMVQDAEKRTGPVLAVDKDPRIIPLGRFIRATRLDELPQLFNVLIGDMSLVGPRPERPFFTDQFKEIFPHYTYRLSVKPGITGLAQVMAKYSTTVEDKLRFDLMYVRNYSLALDIKILMQTIRVVLQREQATGVKVGDSKVREDLAHLFGIGKVVGLKDHFYPRKYN